MTNFSKAAIRNRRAIQAVIATGVYLATSAFGINLLWVLVAGTVLGILFGKVFCRWACPIGFFMELAMSFSKDGKFRQMYQYHKLGCPIAWISGALNKYSLFRIRRNTASCTQCGACDKVCYISSLEPSRFSLFKAGKENPASSFSCSKCLECVAVCPVKSLTFTSK